MFWNNYYKMCFPFWACILSICTYTESLHWFTSHTWCICWCSNGSIQNEIRAFSPLHKIRTKRNGRINAKAHTGKEEKSALRVQYTVIEWKKDEKSILRGKSITLCLLLTSANEFKQKNDRGAKNREHKFIIRHDGCELNYYVRFVESVSASFVVTFSS